jgi:hypothetical protein
MSADGTWNITINTPMGAQNATLELKTADGTLSGSMKSPQGGVDFDGGSVSGDDLTWTAEMTQPMPMTLGFTATVSGDTLNGKVKFGAMGESTMTGSRA